MMMKINVRLENIENEQSQYCHVDYARTATILYSPITERFSQFVNKMVT